MLATGSLNLSVVAQATGLSYLPTGGLSPSRNRSVRGASQTLGYGSASGQMNLYCSFSITLVAGASQTINLYDGSVLDVFGQPAPFRTLRSFAAWIASGGDSSGVTIKPAVSNGNPLWWGGTNPTKTIFPGGPAELGGSPAGVTVGSSTYGVTFTNNGAVAVVLNVMLAGGNV